MIYVNNKQFFHINSKANASPYDLMEVKSTIVVGENTNPFFNYYEKYSRTYEVREPNNTIQSIPGITFLKNVKEGNIIPDNLPAISYDISKHFMMLARELVWESIRIKYFPECPSRQKCLWLIKDEETVRKWLPVLGFCNGTYSIVRVRATGIIAEVDSQLLVNGSEPLSDWYENARKYWSGEMTNNPLSEILFNGALCVDEII